MNAEDALNRSRACQATGEQVILEESPGVESRELSACRTVLWLGLTIASVQARPPQAFVHDFGALWRAHCQMTGAMAGEGGRDRVRTSDAPAGSCTPHAGVPTRVPDPPLALGRQPGSLMSGERGRDEGRRESKRNR